MDLESVIKLHGWTIARLARYTTNRNGKAGTSSTHFYKYIRKNPSYNKIKEIANIMQIPVIQIIAELEDLNNPLQYDESVCKCPNCGQYIRITTETKINIEKA